MASEDYRGSPYSRVTGSGIFGRSPALDEKCTECYGPMEITVFGEKVCASNPSCDSPLNPLNKKAKHKTRIRVALM
jgi:hypothetical protein